MKSLTRALLRRQRRNSLESRPNNAGRYARSAVHRDGI